MAREGSVTVPTALAYSTNRNNLMLSLHDLTDGIVPEEEA
jgi:hypothetical protein